MQNLKMSTLCLKIHVTNMGCLNYFPVERRKALKVLLKLRKHQNSVEFFLLYLKFVSKFHKKDKLDIITF